MSIYVASLVADAGASCGVEHLVFTQTIEVTNQPMTVSGSVAIHEKQDFARVTPRHLLAVLEELQANFVMGDAAFGRVITLQYGWGHDVHSAPTKLSEYALLPGYTMVTWGGASDPSLPHQNTKCPLGARGISALLKPLPPMGGRAMLYWTLSSVPWGTQASAKATACTLIVRGALELWGGDVGL